MRLIAATVLALTISFKLAVGPATAAELVMFESEGCDWCEVWDEEVGVIYAKTDEAKVAPLKRLDIDDPRKGSLSKIRPVMYTPTFVMMDAGKEVGRIMGYPGEDNFWWLLSELVAKVKAPVSGCRTSQTASTGISDSPKC